MNSERTLLAALLSMGMLAIGSIILALIGEVNLRISEGIAMLLGFGLVISAWGLALWIKFRR